MRSGCSSSSRSSSRSGSSASASAREASASVTSSATQRAGAGRRPSRTPRSAPSRTRRTRRRSGTSRPRSRPRGTPTTPIEALQSYVALRPKNTDALRELAALVPPEGVGRTGARADLPGTLRLPRPGRHPRHDLPDRWQPRSQPDPITNAVSTSYDREISAAVSELQSSSAQAVEMYRKITADPAERPERPARARPGCAVGERRRDDDRRVQGVPQARAGRPDRTRGSPAPEAARAVRRKRLEPHR